MPELVAFSADEYVRLAVGLAHNRERLAAFRGSLRERVKKSPLLDVKSQAQSVEAAYREMWRRWCRKPTA